MTRTLIIVVGLILAPELFAQDEPPLSEEFKKKWTTDPANADPRWEEAAASRMRGDVDRAIELYTVFLEESANEVSVLISMGTAFWEKGELAEAEKWLLKAKDLVPKHVKARQFLGKLKFDSGRFSEAKQEYEDLRKLEWCPVDVRASAALNLAKIALLERRYSDSTTLFNEVAESPERGDRATAEKGRGLATRLRRTLLWPREKTEHLDITFSPEAKIAADGGARKAYAAKAEAAFVAGQKKLGSQFKEHFAVFVFKDDPDAFAISNQESIHSFRYSWWFVWTAENLEPGHDLAHQMVARIRGSRPASQILVEGLACYADSESADAHQKARELKRAGKLRSIVDLHADQSYSMDTAREAGESFVAYLIQTHGLNQFLDSYRMYNVVLLNPEWRIRATGQFRWSDALSEVLRRGVGQTLPEVEAKWHAFLGS